ncbi:MAG TPA: serine/threonine-protein kinase [Elainellaceae cyanobacterium]
MSNHFAAPTKQSNYHLLGLVGQGQFGRVFCAIHRKTGRLVALKSLDHQRFPTHQFLRELRFLLSLQHPNIVTCHALEHTYAGRYLVMDYCEGGTLRSLISENDPLNLHQIIRLISDILMGLEHAHNRRIIHCDVKPENILLSVQSEGWLARISDFGIARLCQDLSDKEAGNTGSPAYMAPERFYGQYSITSDLYAVGILLFELIAGYRPFSGTPSELMSAHLNQVIKFPDVIPVALRPILHISLQKLSARRFRSAADMLSMIRSVVPDELELHRSTTRSIKLLAAQPENRAIIRPFKPKFCKPLTAKCIALDIYHASLTSSSKQTDSSVVSDDTLSDTLYACVDKSILVLSSSSNQSLQSPDLEPIDDIKQAIPSLSGWSSVTLPFEIQELFARPQGCFAIASCGLYQVSVSNTFPRQPIAQFVCDLQHSYSVAIAPNGRWLAAITTDGSHSFSPAYANALMFQRLPDTPRAEVIATHPIPLRMFDTSLKAPKVFALDGHHVVIVSAFTGQQQPHSGYQCSDERKGASTRLEFFTRRGNRLGSLTISTLLGQITPTPIPYRLLALDQRNPYSVLLIDLKPFRVMRSPIEIAPQHLAVTNWGYVVVDAEGHILLLDPEGRPINRINGPHHPTAIAIHDPYELCIATWDGIQGCLYTLDLRDTGVDFLI